MVLQRALLVLLLAAPAQAYELKRDSSGEVVRWDGRVEFVVDPRLAQALRSPKAVEAIQGAVAAVEAGTPRLAVTSRTAAPAALGFDFTAGAKNQNDITPVESWRYDKKALAVTILTVDSKAHRILDADIAINAKGYRFAVVEKAAGEKKDEEDDDAPYDIQATLTHELGHALGLAHNDADAGVVMFPGTRPLETNKRLLAKDDLDGLTFLYPAAAAGSAATPEEELAGCSASGLGSPVALFGVLAVLALFARRRGQGRGRARAVPVLGALSLLPAVALAQPPEGKPAGEGARRFAVTAEVHTARTQAPPQAGGLLETEVELVVKRCVEGRCPTSRLVLRMPGGRVGNVEQWVDGRPPLKPGEVVALVGADADPDAGVRIFRLEQPSDLQALVQAMTGGEGRTARCVGGLPGALVKAQGSHFTAGVGQAGPGPTRTQPASPPAAVR